MKLNKSTKWMPSANITPLSLRGRLKPPKWPRIMFTLPNSPFCTASRSHSVAGSKRKMCPTCKMRLCLRDDNHAVHFADEIFVIRREPLGRNAELARGFELFLADFGDIQFDGTFVEVAQMVGTPAAQTQKENFDHRGNFRANLSGQQEKPLCERSQLIY